MNERAQRRLAAIVSTDVVGYSRLMGANETGTLARMKAHRRELWTPEIEKHGGRIVGTAGDSLLVEFASAVSAVECALAVQLGMAEREADQSDESRMLLRVGINIGEVIVDGDDIYGDGVNIAARLQAMAPAGGICLSGKVHDEIAGKVAADFEDAGAQVVKNIARPVQMWRWTAEQCLVADPALGSGDVSVPPDRPSIAVLPFDNISGDPEQEYFSDGITEDIITALSKVSRMRVIARNSSFQYRNQTVEVRKAATELSVRYVLEGSVRSSGTRIRVTAQLIDAEDGGHLWAERYDRRPADIFDIQDDITKQIVTALRVKLTDGEEARLLARGTNDLEAWQLCGKAMELIERWNTSEYLEARSLADQALARDPKYAYAWATLGYTYWWDARLGFTGDADAKLKRAGECVEQALGLDDTLPWALGLKVAVLGTLHRVDEAVEAARRVVRLYPGMAHVRAHLGLALTRAGEYEEATEHFRAAISLNPFSPVWYRNGLARVLLLSSQLDEALDLIDEVLSLEPSHLHSWIHKAYILSQTHRLDDAKLVVKRIQEIAPDLRLEHIPELLMVGSDEIAQRIVDGLKKAGLAA